MLDPNILEPSQEAEIDHLYHNNYKASNAIPPMLCNKAKSFVVRSFLHFLEKNRIAFRTSYFRQDIPPYFSFYPTQSAFYDDIFIGVIFS